MITRLKDGYAACDRCSFGEREVAVAPSGNLYPCERLVGDDRNTEMQIGTVFDGFAEGNYLELLRRRGNANAECAECAQKERCMNWCGCINYATTGQINQVAGIVCFHEQLAIEVADRVGNALYAENNPAFLKQFYYV
ncbi:MAG: SPASM domain-containing protein [Pontiellaceae bacterium]|nr:SPASM domain-containing protein [Pontiellaceae bacterium]